MANEKHARRPWVILLIFAAVIAYIIVVLVTSFTRIKSALIYEVTKGNVSESLVVSGLILRDEEVFDAEESGYIEYYQSSGSKVKVGDIIYSVDKTGDSAELLKSYAGNGEAFSDEEKFQIQSLLSEYRTKYKDVGLEGLYETKAGMSSIFLNSVKELVSGNGDETGGSLSDSIKFFNTEAAGYIVFFFFFYEDLKTDDITEDMFDPDKYTSSGAGVKHTVEAGEPAFKLITGDGWNIYCKLTPEIVKEYELENVKAVTVSLPKAGTTSRANFEIIHKDAAPYALISLNKYVMDYARDRYADFEISTGESAGLQVPNSAVVEGDYYKIPTAYLTQGNNSNAEGFIVEKENGVQFTEAAPEFKNPDFVFVKPDRIKEGSVLIMPDSDERFKVSETQKVKGVYSVNTGYAVFKAIDVISENKEYSVLNENTSGVSDHDRILLNASGYKEGDVVY